MDIRESFPDEQGGCGPIETLESRLRAVREALEAKKAMEVALLDLRPLSLEVDAFLICHGTSPRHVKALCEAAGEEIRESGESLLSVEGLEEAGWVLMDCGDFLIHIFSEKNREFYRLEDLWSSAPLIAPAAPGGLRHQRENRGSA